MRERERESEKERETLALWARVLGAPHALQASKQARGGDGEREPPRRSSLGERSKPCGLAGARSREGGDCVAAERKKERERESSITAYSVFEDDPLNASSRGGYPGEGSLTVQLLSPESSVKVTS